MGQWQVHTRVWRNLADALGLGPSGRKSVEVQILSPAQAPYGSLPPGVGGTSVMILAPRRNVR